MIFLMKILNILKKIDWKIALIIVFSLLTITFGLMWYLKDNNKGLMQQLDKENKEIIADRKIIQGQIDSLKRENIKLLKEKDIENQDIKKINILLSDAVSKSIKSQNDLNAYIYKQRKIEDNLADLRKNPRQLTGDSLLNSLKSHLKK